MVESVEEAAVDDGPPIDPDAIEDAYRFHRARRRARVEHRRRAKHAGIRFWLVLVLLIVLCSALAVTLWREVERLFGL